LSGDLLYFHPGAASGEPPWGKTWFLMLLRNKRNCGIAGSDQEG
jgi:hypothetical protein